MTAMVIRTSNVIPIPELGNTSDGAVHCSAAPAEARDGAPR